MFKLIKFFKDRKKKNKKLFLPLHEPDISVNDINYVTKGLKSGYVSTSGKDIQKFENKIANFTRSKYAIGTITGTAALHIALKILNVNKNEEVLLPSFAFVAAANAILYNSAIPHFVDCELKKFGVDPIKLEKYLKKNTIVRKNKCINVKTKRIIKAIIIVHIFGHPAKIRKLLKIAKKFKLKIVEDAAEALGSLYIKKHVGTFGDVGVLSFNGNKIITTGMGGMILTNSKKLASISSHLISTSKTQHKWEFIHDKIGYNYRMPNLNATLGISQIHKLKKLLSHKRELFKKFKKLVEGSNELSLLDEPKDCKSNFWIQTLVLKKPSLKKRNKLLSEFHRNKILARPIWKPLHKLKYLKKYPKMNLSNTNILEKSAINIPSSFYL